jgi:hypothetical protein
MGEADPFKANRAQTGARLRFAVGTYVPAGAIQATERLLRPTLDRDFPAIWISRILIANRVVKNEFLLSISIV